MSNKPTLGKVSSFDKIKKKKAQKKTEEAGPPPKYTHQPSLQAMVWYKETDYPNLLEIFDDSHLLPQTYKVWLKRAEDMKSKVEAEGDQVMKVYIEPQGFEEWCSEKGLAKDAEARSRLAIEVAQSRSFSL